MDNVHNVLIVDDEVSVLTSIKRELRNADFNVITTSDINQAIFILSTEKISVIISDIIMPVMNGVELLKKSLEISPGTIRIVLTGSTESLLFQSAVNEAHISTFLLKPWERNALILAVEQGIDQYNMKLERERLSRELVDKNNKLKCWSDSLEKLVEERTHEVSLTQEATILSLTALTETRDNETGNHIIRTQNYVKLLAQELAKVEQYSHSLTAHEIDLLYKSAPLHDIGKVGIPDDILKKNGRLTDKEYNYMKKHTEFGRDAIGKAVANLGKTSFLSLASDIAYSHHEKWNGTGYPLGLKGDEIPLAARIMALADVYDALISKRCYKDKIDHDHAVSIIKSERGKHFQTLLVDIFIQNERKFRYIAEAHTDF